MSDDDDNLNSLLDDRTIRVSSSEHENNDINYETTNDLESELSEFRSKWKKELNEQQKGESNNEKITTQETKVEIIQGRKIQQTSDSVKDVEDEFNDTSNEEKAEYLFKKGVMLEQQGQFYEAIKFYRMAMQFDENVEFKVASQKQIQQHYGEYKGGIEHEIETLSLNDNGDVELTLLEQFQASILNERLGLCEKNYPQRSTHFSELPIEVVMLILRWVVGDDLDVRSLEVISCVSKGLYVCSRDPEIWKLICESIWKDNIGSYKIYGSWREMYLNRPRLNFDGLYISKCSYIRAGEQSLDSFYRPWHLVEYFRYLRFFTDGSVVMLTTPDEPKIGVTKLKTKIDNRDPYVIKGNWTLESNKVINPNIYLKKRLILT